MSDPIIYLAVFAAVSFTSAYLLKQRKKKVSGERMGEVNDVPQLRSAYLQEKTDRAPSSYPSEKSNNVTWVRSPRVIHIETRRERKREHDPSAYLSEIKNYLMLNNKMELMKNGKNN